MTVLWIGVVFSCKTVPHERNFCLTCKLSQHVLTLVCVCVCYILLQ